MFLKKLKIAGFKSFADPVSLEFSQGISAIVGPNGSGKSNITDAIKWVLGEQSIKSLRGKKMEDVIFSGTEKKPPSGYAEVVLVLDNTDEAIKGYPREVAVSRKLFRSGDSEYAINKKNCKLKDVHHLFMDTGLGKNGYSLISQGGIESIIASTPAELRAIFEEAVGIVSYKTKKNEAEKKLNQTQQHIDRLMDIIQEIEKQMLPLKKQSEKAQIYQTLRDELKIQDLVLFYQEIKQNTEKLKIADEKFREQNKKCQENEAEISQLDNIYQKRTVENRELSIELTRKRSEMEALDENKATIVREIVQINSQLESNQKNDERLSYEKGGLEEDITKISNQVKTKEEQTIEKNKTLENLIASIKKIDVELQALQTKENLEKQNIWQQQKNIVETQKSEENLVENRISLRTELQDLLAQVKFFSESLDRLNGEINSFLDEQKKYAQEIESLSGQLIEDSKKLSEQKNGVQENQVQYKKCTNAIQALSNHLKVDNSKVEYLKNIQKNYQDYFPAIRKLMTSEKLLGSTIKNVFGPVGELIQIDIKYLQAIEVSLGAKSQNIVVSTVSIARECIDLLKQQKLGRATFLPLDNLRVASLDQNLRKQIEKTAGVEGFASDLVKTDDKFKSCIESLLGRTAVVSNFENGKSVSQKFNGRFTVVTLDGEIFYPGGAIVGGQNKDSKQSPMSKKIEIDQLESEIKKNQLQLEKCLKLEEQLKSKLDSQSLQVGEIETEIGLLKQSIWEKNKALEDINDQLLERRKNQHDFAQKAKKIEIDRQRVLKELAEIEEQYEQTKRLTRKPISEEQLNALRAEIEDKKTTMTSLQMKETEKNGEIRSDNNEIRLLKQQLDQKIIRADQISEEILESRSAHEALEKRLAELAKSEETVKTQVSQQHTALSKDEEKFKENNDALLVLQEKIKVHNHDLIINNDEKNRLQTSMNSCEMKLAHLEEAIQKNYQMNMIMVEDAVLKYQESGILETYEISQKRQRVLSNQIAGLGNINLNALEEYQEITSRHTYLKQQIDDLQMGRKELLDIIGELYEAMTEQFKANFIKLQENFSKIFSILFEGGRAYLEFTDPTGVLEGGIELVAQPPGKRLRHISLLSGGEKSMVAIALLFSFLEINPSPFCVIDEIDAALDDHNIYRYINYLKTLSHENQFITITHRRTTLEVCDDLYGVSMSKEGVSQLVSVRLTDYV
ncbi:chromosome segregation protein SMC [Eubacteriaceae bacterium ES2]|nr:chromosome segregation protein SMC [Eubacteriaceae bacterium ES2]